MFRQVTLFFFALVVCTLSYGRSQNAGGTTKDDHFVEDLAETRDFSIGRPVQAQPSSDGKRVFFLRALSSRNPELALYEFDPDSRQTLELLTPEKAAPGTVETLSPEEKARRERTRTTSTGFTTFALSKDGSRILLSLSGKLYLLPLATREVQELKTGEGGVIDPKFSPNGSQIAYVRHDNLYLYDLASQREQPITTGGTERVSYGVAEFVAQEEMGRTSGFWWTSDGKSLIYQITDQTPVEIWNVADPAFPQNPPYRSYYPRPGKANVSVKLMLQSIDQKNQHLVEWDHEKYPYLVRVSPSDNGPLTITVETRDQHELDLLQVDPDTGHTTELIAEQDRDWVNINQPMPYWLDRSHFLWTSEREGGWQLELRQASGQLDRILVPWTDGYFHWGGVAQSDIYYLGGQDPAENQLWKISLDEKKPCLVSPGFHQVRFNQDQQQLYIDAIESPTSLARTYVRQFDGTLVGEIPSIAENPPYEPRTEFVRVASTEPGSTLDFNAVIVRPRHFDSAAKYRVLVDVYGGPQHNQVTRTAKPYLLDQWQADQGFIVVSIDGRGTPNRGRDWERAIYQKFGEIPLQDQISALKALANRYHELDLQRVGITGWSFGGYMSALAVIRRPDIFKAAVAGAPVTDWLDYDTHYTERYLGLPGIEVYDASSILKDAAKLVRPLLIIHGTADDNVYVRHSLRLINELFRAGRSFEFLPLIGTTHMTPDPIEKREIEKRTIEFFERNL